MFQTTTFARSPLVMADSQLNWLKIPNHLEFGESPNVWEGNVSSPKMYHWHFHAFSQTIQLIQ